MRVHRGTFAVLSTGIVLANAPFARAQDATSANLPEHLDTGEAMLTPKPKKKKAESSLKIAARSSSQKRAYVTEHTPPPEEPVTSAAPLERKLVERSRPLRPREPTRRALQLSLHCRYRLPKPWQ